MARPLLGVGENVCDFTLFMRARLLFGLYNHLAVPTRYKIVAKLYCFSFFLLLKSILIFFILTNDVSVAFMYFVSRCVYHGFNIIWSIFTEEKYISSYCIRINLTDVTVDSAIIFPKVEKKVKFLFTAMFFSKTFLFLVNCVLVPKSCDVFNWSVIATYLFEISINFIFVSNFVVLSIYNSRLRLLRLKLERYGFNSRHCRIGINIYCDIYSKIIEELQKRSSIKITIIIEIVFTTTASIFAISFYVFEMIINNNSLLLIPMTLVTLNLIVPIFGFCAELESAASQVEAIREFTVTELIKQPCERSRRAMLELLALTEEVPARVSLCRAVCVDARLAIAVLSFCSARIVLLLQAMQK